jgi:hypothetical protein
MEADIADPYTRRGNRITKDRRPEQKLAASSS